MCQDSCPREQASRDFALRSHIDKHVIEENRCRSMGSFCRTLRNWIFPAVESARDRSSSPVPPSPRLPRTPCHAVCEEIRAGRDPGRAGGDRAREVDARADHASDPGAGRGNGQEAQGGQRREQGPTQGLHPSSSEEEHPAGLLPGPAGSRRWRSSRSRRRVHWRALHAATS